MKLKHVKNFCNTVRALPLNLVKRGTGLTVVDRAQIRCGHKLVNE